MAPHRHAGPLLTLLAAAVLAVSLTGCWPQFRANAAHTGENQIETEIGADNVAALTVGWTGLLGGGYRSAPTAATGQVYAETSSRVDAYQEGCHPGGEFPFCTPLWHGTMDATADDLGSGAPALAGGVVYAGSGRRLFAFPASCGTGNASCSPLWTSTPAGGTVTAGPAVADGKVYVGSRDGYLYAFPAACGTGGATCAPLWRGHVTSVPPDQSIGLVGVPAVSDGIVYAGSSDGGVYAFGASCGTGGATCAPLWTGATAGILGSPAVAGGTVYVKDYQGKVYAFPAACGSGGGSCSPRWTASTVGNTPLDGSSPAVANGLVYATGRSSLYAFAASCGSGGATCTPSWVDHGDTSSANFSSPSVANGVVYIGSTDHGLYGFPAQCASAGCAKIARLDLGASIGPDPTVSNGTVYVTTDAGRLDALSLPPGARRNRVSRPPSASPRR